MTKFVVAAIAAIFALMIIRAIISSNEAASVDTDDPVNRFGVTVMQKKEGTA